MKDYQKIIITIVFLVIIISVIFSILSRKKQGAPKEEYNNLYSEIDKNEVSYKENITIEELKEEKSITGDSNLYEVQEEYDGRKVLNIKAEIQYQVAFAGIFEKQELTVEKAKNIYNEKYPQKSGVWVEENSRERFLTLIKQKAKSSYDFDEQGYLIIKEEIESDIDKKIINAIESEKQFVVSFASSYSHVDTVTGIIEDYPFEQLDPYQAYDVCQDGDKFIVFISENEKGMLNDLQILDELIRINIV